MSRAEQIKALKAETVKALDRFTEVYAKERPRSPAEMMVAVALLKSIGMNTAAMAISVAGIAVTSRMAEDMAKRMAAGSN